MKKHISNKERHKVLSCRVPLPPVTKFHSEKIKVVTREENKKEIVVGLVEYLKEPK
jgi:hypothetical protein